MNAHLKVKIRSRRGAGRKGYRGFSLIELLIVVAIILIVAAIAIPNLLKSKMTANEASTVQSLRTVNTGEMTYAAMCPDVGYSATLVELNTGAICSSAQNIIDNLTGSGSKSGYTYTYTPVASASGLNTAYSLVAVPIIAGVTGQRGFFTDHSGVLRYSLTGAVPNVASSALQ